LQQRGPTPAGYGVHFPSEAKENVCLVSEAYIFEFLLQDNGRWPPGA